MRFLIFGAGAIGTYLGGSLLQQKHEVVFLERPIEAEQLCHQGLLLQIKGKTIKLTNFDVAASLEEALKKGLYDAALFALKSYDTAKALTTIQPLAADLPPLLCLQNGVENIDEGLQQRLHQPTTSAPRSGSTARRPVRFEEGVGPSCGTLSGTR